MKAHPEFQRPSCRGFTLIELLVVVAIMAILAALIIPLGVVVGQKKAIARAKAEMGKLETAIEAYKAKMGFYPPGNGILNPLFYELTGTYYTNSRFVSVLGESLSTADIQVGVDGFVNSSTDPSEVSKFLRSWQPNEIGKMKINGKTNVVFVLPVEGPRGVYFQDTDGHWETPWFYDASSTNRFNADSYDLWIDLIIGGKTNRIRNWSDQPVIVAY